MAGFNLGSIGHLLEQITGGAQYGGGFVGDMRGLGHIMMENYRMGLPGYQANPNATSSGFIGAAAPPTPQSALTPLVPAPPIPAPAQNPTLAQILALMKSSGNGGSPWGTGR